MIIVYQGRQSYLPLAACKMHLNQPLESIRDSGDKAAVPLAVVGIDQEGNTVCSLVSGKYGDIYNRAIEGIAEIFGLEVELVNVDHSLERSHFTGSRNYLRHMAIRYCPQLCKNEWITAAIRSAIKQK